MHYEQCVCYLQTVHLSIFFLILDVYSSITVFINKAYIRNILIVPYIFITLINFRFIVMPFITLGSTCSIIFLLSILTHQISYKCLWKTEWLVSFDSCFIVWREVWSPAPFQISPPPSSLGPPSNSGLQGSPFSLTIWHMIPWNSPNGEMDGGHIWVW